MGLVHDRPHHRNRSPHERGRCSRPTTGGRLPRRVHPRRHTPATPVGRLARPLGRHHRGPHATEARASDGRRRDRRAGRTPHPHRRPLAHRLGVLQLPRVRPGRRDHRGRAGVPGHVGHAPQLVPAPREPASLRGDRGDDDRAPRLRGRPAPSHDHAHPHVGAAGAGRGRHRVPGRQSSQDDLRRRHGRGGSRRTRRAVPPQRRRPPGRAPRRQPPRAGPRDRDGRREFDDRQRAGSRRVRPPGGGTRRSPVRRRRARVRRHR